MPLPVHLLFGDPHRIAVEGRIGKEPRGGAGVVENVEPELAVVIPDARPAPDDLLELAHRADDAGQHDVLASRRIDAGREHLRCREDRGHLGVDVLKAAQMATADVAFIGRDAADIVRILATKSLLRLLSARPHFAGMFLIDAEHDRLGEAVGLLHELG